MQCNWRKSEVAMKVSLAVATILLACAVGFGQNQPPAPQGGGPPPGMQGGPGPGGRGQMRAQMQEQMKRMQGDLQELQSRVEKLRADTNNVRDPATKAALLDDVALWDQTVHHMQSNLHQMRMMMQGGGPGGTGGM
jgi:TolA-binding protein